LVHPFKSAELDNIDNSKEKTRQDNAINACSNLKDECHTLHDCKTTEPITVADNTLSIGRL